MSPADRTRSVFAWLGEIRRSRIGAAVVIPLLAIFTAFVVGAVIVVAAGTAPSQMLDAYRALFEGSFGSRKAISETLTAATPLILTGLSVAVAFKAGLFNIGGEGQFLCGGMFAVWAGFTFTSLPAVIHVMVAVAAGIVGGALWGLVPGLLKARSGAHEVIVTIMMNFIALRLVDYFLKSSLFQREGRNDPISKNIESTAMLPKLVGWWDGSLRVHFGLLLALAATFLMAWLLFRTTIGFEIRALGNNPHASRYAGMSSARTYVLVMMLAGGLAGLAGTSQVLGVLDRASPGFSSGLGFDGIAVALLGRSHPWGVVASAVLFGALRAGGQQMQATAGVGIDLIGVIQALVIIFVAAPALISALYRLKTRVSAEAAAEGSQP